MRIVLRHQAAPAAFSRLTERNLAALPVRASPCQDCLGVPAQGPAQRFRLGCDFSATVEVFRPLPAHLALLECARPSLRPRSFRVRRTFSQGRDLKCFGKKKPRALPGPCVAGLGLGLVFRDHGRGPGTEPVVSCQPADQLVHLHVAIGTTGSSNPLTISSITAATPGTRSSISPGRSCPSRAAIGRPWVTQCEDWCNLAYYLPEVRRAARSQREWEARSSALTSPH